MVGIVDLEISLVFLCPVMFEGLKRPKNIVSASDSICILKTAVLVGWDRFEVRPSASVMSGPKMGDQSAGFWHRVL